MNIARTTLSSKILAQHKDYFAKMCVDAVVRLKKSGNLDAIQITRVPGGTLEDSFLDEGENRILLLSLHGLIMEYLISEGEKLFAVLNRPGLNFALEMLVKSADFY